MAKEKDETPKVTPAITATQGQLGAQLAQQNELAKQAQRAALPSAGILDQAQGQAPDQQDQVHTFGAWCRAKGVKMAQVQEALRSGRVSGTGDGPAMTEAEFDKAVDFQLTNVIQGPLMQRHIKGDEVSQGRAGRQGPPDDEHDEPSR